MIEIKTHNNALGKIAYSIDAPKIFIVIYWHERRVWINSVWSYKERN